MCSSDLIGTFFNNIYYVVIGKYFAPADLGQYTRAELFRNLPSQSISEIATSVGYPVLSKVQNDPIQLKAGFRRIITSTFFIVAMLMFGLAASADSMVITLVGIQWKQSVIYLQLLCITGLLYPLNSINVNLLNVVGRSDLYMKKQLILQILTIPVILVGVKYGIIAMIIGINVNGIIGLLIYSNAAYKFSGYSIKDQIYDITPTIIIGGIMGLIVFLTGYFSHMQPPVTMFVQVSVGLTLVLVLSILFKNKEFDFIMAIIISKLNKAHR